MFLKFIRTLRAVREDQAVIFHKLKEIKGLLMAVSAQTQAILDRANEEATQTEGSLNAAFAYIAGEGQRTRAAIAIAVAEAGGDVTALQNALNAFADAQDANQARIAQAIQTNTPPPATQPGGQGTDTTSGTDTTGGTGGADTTTGGGGADTLAGGQDTTAGPV